MPNVDVKRVAKQSIEEGIKKSIQEALGDENTTVEEAAKEWAVKYCEFAGLPHEEAVEAAEGAKVEEVCGARVAEAYEKFV